MGSPVKVHMARLPPFLICLVSVATSAVLPPTTLDFGNYTFPINDTAAQPWFDQGLMHLFGFNMDEARAAFVSCEAAAPLHPMCSWGVGMADGTNLNHATLTSSEVASAHAAVQRALTKATAHPLPPKQSTLLDAIAVRYPADPDGNQVGTFALYAAKMQQAAEAFPADADVLALAAEAQMDLCRRFYHGYYPISTMDKPQGGFLPRALIAKSLLETAMLKSDNPSHPLALHLYIHLTEAGSPGHAGAGIGEAAADKLAELNISGFGHLEHMPGHMYLRVGRYAEAVVANTYAHAADATYVKAGMMPYGPAHNSAFHSYAAAMDGQQSMAYKAAADMRVTYQDPALNL